MSDAPIAGSLRKQGVGISSIVQQNQEFSIQNEDFPALPGYKGAILILHILTISFSPCYTYKLHG